MFIGIIERQTDQFTRAKTLIIKRKSLILTAFYLLNTIKIGSLQNSAFEDKLASQEIKIAFLSAKVKMEQSFKQKIILQEQINLQLENALWLELISLDRAKNELLELKKELELRATDIFLQNNSTNLIGKIIELGLSGASIFDNFYLKRKQNSGNYQ